MAVSGVIFKTKLDAVVPIEPDVLPPVRPRKKPLKFWPIGEDGAALAGPPSASALPGLVDVDDETRNTVATYEMVATALDGAIAVTSDAINPLKAQIAGLQVEAAQLKGVVAELRSQIAQIAFIQERLSIDRQGRPGQPGLRGRDGPPGVRGERGERGEPGRPAPAVIEWRPDPEAFTIQAVLSDGSTGPMIALRSLFEAYDAAASLLDDRDIAAASAEARAELERQTESHWAK
ncbi:hypothetical protein SAMN05519103_01948 [Rhizobiales bacterium GAS113]|nr:hypothetical protein SAMN05519103_01948 [Rhizobiales bacterium GAS113]